MPSINDSVHALFKCTIASPALSVSGEWWEATVREISSTRDVKVHFFGWSSAHDEWIQSSSLGSRMRQRRGPCLKYLMHKVPEGERDIYDEESMALPVAPNVSDYLLVQGDDSRWHWAEINNERDGVSGREVLARDDPGGRSGAGSTWEEWIPCSDTHRFRLACSKGHLMLRACCGPAVACADYSAGLSSCPDGCPELLQASHARVWCPSCAVHVCLACASSGGTDPDPYGQAAAKAQEAASRRETIEGGRRARPPLANSPESPSTPPVAPTEQHQHGIDRLCLLAETDSERERIVQRLRDSLPDATVRNVYVIDHEPARRRFELELELCPDLRDTTKLLWHSTGGGGAKPADVQVSEGVPLPSSDPLDLIGSRFPFDSTFAKYGTYGTRALCFAEHAIYPELLLPCRRSALELHGVDSDDGEERRRRREERSTLPQVGDDVMLRDDAAVYEVTEVGTGTEPSKCRLRRLFWKTGDPGAGRELWHDLGDSDSWATADVHYLILADVALGNCQDYGKEEPNIKGTGDIKTDPLPREPEGFHSVCGTEQE